MNTSWIHRRRSAAPERPQRSGGQAARGHAHRWRWLAAVAAAGTLTAGTLAACVPASAGHAAARPAASGPAYAATIVRTAYGIPHITARSFGSLGFGYGFAFAGDDLCTMANYYVTVEGHRSRYFGPDGSYTLLASPIRNLDSDAFWQSVIDRRVISRLLAVRTGPGAIGPQLRQLITGYVAGYNRYLASVGGARGVPDQACRGQAWVKPITTMDAYLRLYQLVDLFGSASDPGAVANAQPPASSTAAVRRAAAGRPAGRPDNVELTAATLLAGRGQRAQAATPAGLSGLPGDIGSNAIAVGSAGTRDHQHGMLLGNPHFLWAGPERFYQVQLTIPGTMNVQGATFYGMPLVAVGFTATMAWTQTTSTASTVTPYQLTLVPGHPTEYLFNGKPAAMAHRRITVDVRLPGGKIRALHHTLWSTRYGPMIDEVHGTPLPWTTSMAFALADANASNFRFLNHFLATDEAHSAAQELSILRKYQGIPWLNTLAADSTGHALYADIGAIPDVTNAELARCDTALGTRSLRNGGPPILDGSRSSCAWGTDKDSAAPGIFGPSEEPVLMRRDFVENSNDSYWMSNPARPLTGFPAIIGGIAAPAPFTDLGLRTRSALTMVTKRIAGTDGLGPAGFTFRDMKNLMFSDIQYGATLVKPQLVSMCRSLPHGRAPRSNGATIAVGDSCRVLAAWNGRENPGSRGAVLFREFWGSEEASFSALDLPNGPWSHPFTAANPVHTPYGLDTASKAVRTAFGDALAELKAEHLPYNVALGTVQYVLRNGRKIPLPGGPGDPNGEFNAIEQFQPGVVLTGSSYIQVVTWKTGDPCPQAATLLTYSESDNPASPHYADQTRLFSHREWATARFCPAQIAAHAVSTTQVRGR